MHQLGSHIIQGKKEPNFRNMPRSRCRKCTFGWMFRGARGTGGIREKNSFANARPDHCGAQLLAAALVLFSSLYQPSSQRNAASLRPSLYSLHCDAG
ncbi:hypothetical protein AAFF_G00384070 [Aldrovandia affinis]|uniref:Uncharacterized protein n=1 Tax=Aldrovandia affinis TaxID=143900 RepID=A0AAD7WLU1_9TELE|nr:hypothetical protein AAFF_G00384070 [Aldrovandia affinis]